MTVVESAALRDRYELLAELGEGGSGTVFKARQRATGQHVAIKILRLPGPEDAAASARRVARFQLETQLCAQLQHPNIVRLIDSGGAGSAVLFSVFEFAPGKNLAEVLAAEGRIDPHEARHLLGQTLDALACAHGRGVVHRDLKPANIMVIPTGARRNALVVDFGIGARIEVAPRDGVGLVPANDAMGTPAYAAPEQLRGFPATPRSDLYAWGLVFLECLTGRRVVSGHSLAEVVAEQCDGGPVLMPSCLAAHPLGALLRRAIEKDPAARSVTAEDLLRELEAIELASLREPLRRAAEAAALAASASVPEAAAVTTARAERLAEAPQPGLMGERRQVTVLCCATTATGPRGEALDVEAVDALDREQRAFFAETARRFDGQVAGAFADQVLLTFGAVRARDDDACRAAAAALAIAAGSRERAAQWQAEGRGHLDVQVGLHTGLVVRHPAPPGGRGEAEPLVVGSTARVASRLCALARPGSVWLGAESRHLLRAYFLVEERPAAALDRGGRALPLYELVGESRAPGPAAAPLVGRDDELATLREQVRLACAGDGQAVLVSGEPGSGKSRLLAELARRLAPEPHRWLECRCSPDSGQSALAPLAALLAGLSDGGAATAKPDPAAALEAFLAGQGFDLAEAMPLFAALLAPAAGKRAAALAPHEQTRRTLQALLSLFAELAEKTPLVLVVEDLHWADPTTLELVNQLVRAVASSPLCVLLTTRPELTPTWPASAVAHLRLGSLSPRQIEAMALGLAGGKGLAPALLETLVARSDGVPLFVEELFHAMIESGAAVERDGAFIPARGLAALAIPATLRGPLTARLDRLGGARETAQLAAALGREVDLDVLADLSPKGPAVRADLDALVAAELMLRKRRLKGTAYLFKHALVRDAAYESMPEQAQREVQARIAEVLLARSPDPAAAPPDPPPAAAHPPKHRRAALPRRPARLGALGRPTAPAAAAAGPAAAPRRGRTPRPDPGAPGRS